MKTIGKAGYLVIGLIVAVGAAVLVQGPAAAAGKTYTLACQHYIGPKNPEYIAWENWGKRVHERTEGRLRIKVHPLGELGYSGPDILRAVKDGLLGCSINFDGWSYGEEPLLSVMNLMGISPTMEGGEKAAKALKPLQSKILEEKWNQVLIATWMYYDFLHATKPVRTLADFKGMKIRGWGPLMMESLQALGASGVVTPRGEIYTGLATRVIDGNIASFVSTAANKAYEVAKYMNMWPMANAHAFVTVNKDWLEALPRDIRKVFLEESEKFLEAEEWRIAYWGDRDMKASLEQNGVQIVHPANKEIAVFQEKVKVSWDTFRKTTGPQGEQLLRVAIEAQRK